MVNQDDKEFFGLIAIIAICTLIFIIAYAVQDIVVMSQAELDQKVGEKILELHDHPLTLPIDPITDEEFELFQKINGLSDETPLDSDKAGSIVDVDGNEIVPE